MTISGTDFRPGAAVRFGNAAATSVSVVSGTEMRATTPLSSPGPADVEVRNPDGGTARLNGAFSFQLPALPQQIHCLETFESVNLDITSSSDEHWYEVNNCGLRGRATRGSRVYMETAAPISGSRSLVLDNATGLWANHLQYVPTSQQLQEGIYIAWTTRFARNLGVGAKLHRMHFGGRWLQIGADNATSSDNRAPIRAELDQEPNCPSSTEIRVRNGECAGSTGIYMSPGVTVRWLIFYQKQPGGNGVIKWWVNDQLISHLEGSAIGGTSGGADGGFHMGWSFVTDPWNGEWGRAQQGSTMLVDDVVIANFNPEATQSSTPAASGRTPAVLLEDDFESGSWGRWESSRLLLSTERAAQGRFSARADHLAGSSGGDSAQAFFADYLNQEAPASDLRVEFDLFLDASATVPASDAETACGTTLARLLANDDGQALYGAPFPYAPYLLTLCVDERLEPRFELLRRTGTPARLVFTPNLAAVRLATDRWLRIAYRARLNSPGASDGLLELWVDGQMAARYDNVNFRDSFSGKGWNMFQLAAEDAAPPSQSWYQYWDNVRVVRMS